MMQSSDVWNAYGNRLRHAHDRINLDVSWNTVRDSLPSLMADAQQALMNLKARALALNIPMLTTRVYRGGV
jgi:hypothetical protein